MPETSAGHPVIEQAKGVLMLRFGRGSYESLATLTQWSREADVTLLALCRAMVTGICQGRVTPADHHLVRWLEKRLRGEHPGRLESGGSRRADRAGRGTRDTRSVPDISMARRWRYASAVHAARALGSGA